MENDVIYRKLTSLKRCLERIRSRAPEEKEELFTNYDLQDIISLNL